jgi:hypothetical protein
MKYNKDVTMITEQVVQVINSSKEGSEIKFTWIIDWNEMPIDAIEYTHLPYTQHWDTFEIWGWETPIFHVNTIMIEELIVEVDWNTNVFFTN